MCERFLFITFTDFYFYSKYIQTNSNTVVFIYSNKTREKKFSAANKKSDLQNYLIKHIFSNQNVEFKLLFG